MDKERIQNAVREILIAVGEDPDREGLVETRAQGHLRHIDAAVGHHLVGQVLLSALLAIGGKLRHSAGGGGFAHLAAGIGVDLGIKDQDIDIGPAGHDMI